MTDEPNLPPRPAAPPGRGEADLDDQALRADLFASAFLHAAVGMAVVDAGGAIAAANPAFAAVLDAAPDELRGRSVAEIVHPDDRAAVRAAFARLQAGQSERRELEMRCPRRDGSPAWALLTLSAVRDDDGALRHAVAQIQNLTQQKAVEADARAQQERFRALVTHSSDVICVVSPAAELLFASPALERVLGVSPGAAAPQTLLAIVHPDERERAEEGLAEVAATPGTMVSGEVRLRRRDGSWGWFEVSVGNYLDTPGLEGIVVTLHDHTRLKAAQLATAEALAAEEEANRELTRINQERTDLIGIVGHEFRTPLTSILGYSELLRQTAPAGSETAELAEVIHREGTLLARLVDDMLWFERMRSELALNRRPVDLPALIGRVVDRMRRAHPGRDIRFAAVPLPPISADPDRLDQLATNLIGNAVKYSPDGGVVRVELDAAEGQAHLRVTDEGIGIPAYELDKVFERFHRVRMGPARRIEGSGLGLPIVRQIARLHGGEAWAESELGKGTIVHAVVPMGPDNGFA